MKQYQMKSLIAIHGVLASYIGDTDPHIDEDMTDWEICDEYPIFWAVKELAAVIWEDE